MNEVRDWGDSFVASLQEALAAFVAALPHIIGFLLIIIVGWFIASLVARGLAAVLRRVRFNEFADRAGIDDFIRRMGVRGDSAGFIALIAKWFIRLIALMVAFDALGLPAVSQVLRDLLLWLPNLVVALVVLIVGGLAAKAVANLVRGAVATAGAGSPEVLARVAGGLVWAMAIVVAVNQLGIAETLVNALFIAFVFALALGAGLAFGLGGRETAAKIVQGWYQRRQELAQKMRDAAAAGGEMAREQREQRGQVRVDPAAGTTQSYEPGRPGQPRPAG